MDKGTIGLPPQEDEKEQSVYDGLMTPCGAGEKAWYHRVLALNRREREILPYCEDPPEEEIICYLGKTGRIVRDNPCC